MEDDKPTLLMAMFYALHNVEAKGKAEEVATTEQGSAWQRAIDLDKPSAQVHLR